jgi:hypothetical protein
MSIRTPLRKIRTISFPLSALSERKVRVSYKQLNSLPTNTTEEKIFSLIGTNSIITMPPILIIKLYKIANKS